MQNESLHSLDSRQVFNGHITEEIIYKEFVKMGMQEFIANDLSKRYYRNELTYKDIEYLENNFNLKLEMLERSLKAEVISVKNELDNKINSVRNELKSDIFSVINEISLVRKDIEINKIELKKDISNLEKNNKWIFGLTFALWLTVLGGFIALIFK